MTGAVTASEPPVEAVLFDHDGVMTSAMGGGDKPACVVEMLALVEP